MDAEALGAQVMPLLAKYVPMVVGFLVAIFVTWIVAGWAKRITTRALERASFDPTLTKFFGNAARYTVLILGVVSCLGVFGIQTAGFAGIIAAGGLAVGLAFQGTLSNFASGVMLLVFRPFKVGDVVNVAGQTGKIDEIELFTTAMTTPDNRKIILPNSAIFGSTIENITHFDTRRCDVVVGAAYDADIDETRATLEGAIGKIDGVLSEPASQVYLADLGACSVDYALRVWCKTADYWAVREALVRQVKYDLDEKGIGIPFPQMDVHMDAPLVEALGKTNGQARARA